MTSVDIRPESRAWKYMSICSRMVWDADLHGHVYGVCRHVACDIQSISYKIQSGGVGNLHFVTIECAPYDIDLEDIADFGGGTRVENGAGGRKRYVSIGCVLRKGDLERELSAARDGGPGAGIEQNDFLL